MLLIGLLSLGSLTSASAASKTFTNAVSFYETYGSGKIVFSEGAFYYASRGKAGDPKGIRYGVLGQKFTMAMGKETTYQIGIALETSTNSGSCKRISYIKQEGYYYSLYQVSYEDILSRMQTRYPKVAFQKLMYNQKIQCQIDFYLCLVKDGEDQGNVTELENGRVELTGTVYQKAEQIQKAANWSPQTMEALKHYYGIQMQIQQPSSWFAVYHKNDSIALGTMQQQEFVYGKSAKLTKCAFKRILSVTLDAGYGKNWQGVNQIPVTTFLKSKFLGWSLQKKGNVSYQDQQSVKNLSDEHGAKIHLYANWSKESMKLPDMQADGLEFLGWSTEKIAIYSADTNQKELQKLNYYPAGTVVTPKKNTTFYAVWKWKRYKVQFQTPENGTDESKTTTYYYNKEEIQQIREWIVLCGFVGKRLNEMICGRMHI